MRLQGQARPVSSTGIHANEKLLQLIKFQGLVLPYILKCQRQSKALREHSNLFQNKPPNSAVSTCGGSTHTPTCSHNQGFSASSINQYLLSPWREEEKKEEVSFHRGSVSHSFGVIQKEHGADEQAAEWNRCTSASG